MQVRDCLNLFTIRELIIKSNLASARRGLFDCELCSRSPRNYFCDDDDDEGTFLKILLKLAKKGLIGLFV